jgi:hypothetical protein
MTSPTTNKRRTRPAGSRGGYVVAAALNAALLYMINVSPGWTVVPFLTADMSAVLPWINASLAVGIAVNVVYLIVDDTFVKGLGDLLTLSVGLIAMISLWTVFPFDFGPQPGAWPTLVRVLLAFGIVGTVIAMITTCVAILRSVPAHSRSYPRSSSR